MNDLHAQECAKTLIFFAIMQLFPFTLAVPRCPSDMHTTRGTSNLVLAVFSDAHAVEHMVLTRVSLNRWYKLVCVCSRVLHVC